MILNNQNLNQANVFNSMYFKSYLNTGTGKACAWQVSATVLLNATRTTAIASDEKEGALLPIGSRRINGVHRTYCDYLKIAKTCDLNSGIELFALKFWNSTYKKHELSRALDEDRIAYLITGTG